MSDLLKSAAARALLEKLYMELWLLWFGQRRRKTLEIRFSRTADIAKFFDADLQQARKSGGLRVAWMDEHYGKTNWL